VLSDGLIGEITTVNIDFFVPAHFGGFREKIDHILLIDMAIHPFDAVRCLTGAKAKSVGLRGSMAPQLTPSQPGNGAGSDRKRERGSAQS
jgi:predicted dehydrogenase